MRALSLRQASNCETAREEICKCRCGGVRHGAMRTANPDAKFFASLPSGDSHHIDDADQKRAKAKAEHEERQRKRMAMLSDLAKARYRDDA